MADNNETKSKRDLTLERMRGRYPDKQFEDDESIFGQINDDYDEYDKKLSDYAGREEALSKMFTSDPRSARMMMEWKDGGDPAVALIRIYGNDILDAVNDPEKQEAIKQANEEFAKRVADEEKYEKEYKENLAESLKLLDNMAAERGVSDDAIDGAMKQLASICKDFMLGKISAETIEMMLKAQNHDRDVADAKYEGEVAGRNAKIEEKFRSAKKGDGLAHVGGKGIPVKPKAPRRDLGALENYGDDYKDVYELGGAKRVKRGE